MARCSWVPALETLTPSTAGDLGVVQPGVELQRDELALARGEPASARPHGGAAQRGLGVVLGRGASSAAGLGGERGGALAPAQLVQRGVAGDAEQPGALASRGAASKRALLAVGALERERGDVLGRGAVAQQRRHIGEDVVARAAVERLEVQRRAGPADG